MDPVSQRKVAIYIFLGIQVAKFAQIISIFQPELVGLDSDASQNLGLNHIAYWCIADIGFFLFLKRFIPKVKWAAVVLGAVALCGINAGCIALFSGNTVIKEASDYSATKNEESADILLNTSHIIGSHTVSVRPPTLVKFNPNDTVFCLTPNAEIFIPILIKGTPPYYIDLEVYNSEKPKIVKNKMLEMKDAIQIDDTALTYQPSPSFKYDHAFASTEPSRKIQLYGIKVKEPGVYSLKALRESSGDQAKIVKNGLVNIVTCPSAEWKWQASTDSKTEDANGKTYDMCIDQEISIGMQVNGVHPISVLYLESSGRSEQISAIESTGSKTDISDSTSALDAFLKTKSQSSYLPITKKIEISKPHVFKMARITDGLNNTVDYPLTTDTLLPPHDPLAMNWKLFKDADAFVVNGHAPPTASFKDCQDIKIKSVYNTEYEKAPYATVPVALTGNSPFSLALEFKSESNLPPQPLKVDNIENNYYDITAYEAGKFTLVEVKDKFCVGSASIPKECLVQSVSPPKFSFSTSPIEESCYGAVGANLELNFAGEPPFWLEYYLEKTSIKTKKVKRYPTEREKFLKPRSLLQLKPKEPGIYKYNFEKVGDLNYKEGIMIKESSLTQIIHPHSSANFVNRQTQPFVKCINDKVPLSIQVQGSGPWEITYEITHGAKSEKVKRSVSVDNPLVDIEIDQLTEAGSYTVDITEITDGNGCARKLVAEAVTIEVLKSRPTVSFQSAKSIYTLEGSETQLPIFLSGRGPFDIEYRHVATGVTKRARIPGSARSIKVDGTGGFELVSIKDSVCEGHVEGAKNINVLTIPKPTLSISTLNANLLDGVIVRDPVCQNALSEFQVDFIGKAPFKIEYAHQLEGSESALHKDSVDTSFIRLQIDTANPGVHTYEIKSLADDNYQRPLALSSEINRVLQQKVNSIPSVSFLEQEQQVFQCISSKSSMHKLKMKLTGSPPFSIVIEQKLDNQHVDSFTSEAALDQLKQLDDGYAFELPVNIFSAMGKHEFIVESVIDSNSCQIVYDKAANVVSTFVEIADQARITTTNKPIVCIGDLLTYSLQGTPPFTIGYSLNGKRQPDVVVADPILSFWAGVEGVVEINKVCNAAQCCDDNVHLSSVIKSLPKAIVDDGEDFFDDIKEGDESKFHVQFKGEAPFGFTYSRTKHGKNGKKQEEMFTVTDIMSDQWTLNTSQEGTFRVTSIQDKYCSFPRRLASTLGANVILGKE